MSMNFRAAARRKAKGRIALTGPAGAGKTYSALLIAKGLAPTGRIVVLDTEAQSADLYAGAKDLPPFDVGVLEPPFSPRRYTDAIKEASTAGYDVIVIDSLSHAWVGSGGALETVDRIQARGGNKFTAWGDVGKEYGELIETLLRSPAHVIVTMRSKMEYVLEENEKGKKAPRKVGMAPQCRDGIEYEFTCVLDIDITHTATSSKDRMIRPDGSKIFAGQFFTITSEVGVAIREYLDSGAALAPVPAVAAAAPTPREPAPAPPAPRMAEALGEDLPDIEPPEDLALPVATPAAPPQPVAAPTPSPAQRPPGRLASINAIGAAKDAARAAGFATQRQVLPELVAVTGRPDAAFANLTETEALNAIKHFRAKATAASPAGIQP